jgi:hypothetical protein
MKRQSLRSSTDAFIKRGYHANGTDRVRPSECTWSVSPFFILLSFPELTLNNVAIAIQRENNSQSSDKMSSS